MRALLYLPRASHGLVAGRLVAGRALALRVLVAAARAGADVVGVPAALRTPGLERAIGRTRGLRGIVRWLDGGAAEAREFTGSPCLLLPASALLEARTLRPLCEAHPEPAGAALAESADTEAPVVLAPPHLTQRLWDRLARGQAVGDELVRHLDDARPKLASAGGHFLAVSGERDAERAAEAFLYRTVGIEEDSGVDRFLHRRCSVRITRLLVRTPLTPNQVSLASLGIGAAAIWCFWQATPASALLGITLYALASIMDHCDGELARLTFQESRLGAHLDRAIDTLIHSGLVLGMAVSAGGGPMAAVGAVAAVGVALSALFAERLPREAEIGPSVGGVLKSIGNRDTFYLLLLGFVLFLWLLPAVLPALVVVVALGSQAYWVACLRRIRRGAGTEPRS